MESKFNDKPKVSDFDKAYLLAQQIYEDGFRQTTFPELYAWLKTQLDITGLSNTAGLPEPMPTPGANLSTDAANQWVILTPGIYHQPGHASIEVDEGQIVIAQSNGTYYNIIRPINLPRGENGKTIEKFNSSKVDGYTAGSQIVENDKIYEVKLGQSLAEGQKPSENPSKVDIILKGASDLAEVVESSYITKETITLSTDNTEQGSISTSTPFSYYFKVESSSRLRSKSLTYKNSLRSIKMRLPSGFQMAFRIYNEQGKEVFDTYWQENGYIYKDLKDGYSFAWLVKKTTGNINPSEITSDFKIDVTSLANPYKVEYLSLNLIEDGTIGGGGSGGVLVPATIPGTRVRTQGFIYTFNEPLFLKSLLSEDYSYYIHQYTPEADYLGIYTGAIISDQSLQIELEKGYIYRINFLKKDNSSLSVSDIENNITISSAKEEDDDSDLFYKKIIPFDVIEYSQGGWGGTRDKVSSPSNPTYYTRIGINTFQVLTRDYIEVHVPIGFNVSVVLYTPSTIYDSTWLIGGVVHSIDARNYDTYTISVRRANNSNIDTSVIDENFYISETTSKEDVVNKLDSTGSSVGGGRVFNINPTVKMIAHRGFHKIAPENSLDAYVHAGLMGFDLAECDFLPTADGELVLMHDDTINRTMRNASDYSTISTPVNVKDKTLAELRSDYVLISPIVKYRRRIPTLEEYFMVCKEYGLRPLPEIKATGTTNADVLKAYEIGCKIMGKDNFAFCSFSYALLDYARTLSPDLELYYIGASILGTNHAGTSNSRENPKNIWYQSFASVTKELVDQYHTKGMRVGVWTVTGSGFDDNYAKGLDEIAGDVLGANIKTSSAFHASDLDFNDFSHNGEVINNQLLLDNNKILSAKSKDVYFLGNIFLRLRFKGEIQIVSNNLNETVTSSEFITKTYQLAVSNDIPSLLITSKSDGSVVDEVYFAYNKC